MGRVEYVSRLVSARRETPRVLGWPVWRWVALLLVAVVKFLVVAAATVLIGLQAVSACGEPLRFAAIDRAQRRLLVLALVARPCSTWFWVSTR